LPHPKKKTKFAAEKLFIINFKRKMEKNELIAKMNSVLANEFEVEESAITPDANIKETLQLDSLSLVDMIALVEEEFGVEIKGQSVGQVKTFANLYDFVYDKLNA
jgi:acyl carrier protein